MQTQLLTGTFLQHMRGVTARRQRWRNSQTTSYNEIRKKLLSVEKPFKNFYSVEFLLTITDIVSNT